MSPPGSKELEKGALFHGIRITVHIFPSLFSTVIILFNSSFNSNYLIHAFFVLNLQYKEYRLRIPMRTIFFFYGIYLRVFFISGLIYSRHSSLL